MASASGELFVIGDFNLHIDWANSEYSLTYLDICLLLLKNETEKTIHLIHITDGRTTEPDNREEQRQ